MSRKMGDRRIGFIVGERPFELESSGRVSCYRCDFSVAHYDDGLFAEHGIECARSAARAVTKRKAEFLAGRYAAQQAIRNLGVPATNIGVGEHRNPIWPARVVGSITHNATTALCAVAHDIDYASIGIDLENWIPATTAENLHPSILAPSEAALARQISLPFERALTLAFSAKESLFKALYPRVERYFDFDVAAVGGVDLQTRQFRLLLTRGLTRSLRVGSVFDGRFVMTEHGVLTWILAPASL
jgi:enterobactin synthetase component D